MSVGDQFIRNHARREELIKKGKEASFFGERAGDLNKDDLFMMIGLLGIVKEHDKEVRRRDWEFVKDEVLQRSVSQ